MSQLNLIQDKNEPFIITRDQKFIFEVDEFWLSTNCLGDFNIIWIHENEKNPWKETHGACSCMTNSSRPSVRCESREPVNTVLIFYNQHYDDTL